MALVSVLARDNHWARRQTFILLCGALQGDPAQKYQDNLKEIPGEEGGMAVLTSKLLAPLLLLADDAVPNVIFRFIFCYFIFSLREGFK